MKRVLPERVVRSINISTIHKLSVETHCWTILIIGFFEDEPKAYSIRQGGAV